MVELDEIVLHRDVAPAWQAELARRAADLQRSGAEEAELRPCEAVMLNGGALLLTAPLPRGYGAVELRVLPFQWAFKEGDHRRAEAIGAVVQARLAARPPRKGRRWRQRDVPADAPPFGIEPSHHR